MLLLPPEAVIGAEMGGFGGYFLMLFAAEGGGGANFTYSLICAYGYSTLAVFSSTFASLFLGIGGCMTF